MNLLNFQSFSFWGVFFFFFAFSPPSASAAPLPQIGTAQEAASSRIWTDSTGKFRVEATLISQDGDSVKLCKTDGRTVTLPMAKLSVADRDFLAQNADNPFAGGEEDDAAVESDGGFAKSGPVRPRLKSAVKRRNLTNCRVRSSSATVRKKRKRRSTASRPIGKSFLRNRAPR